MREGRAVPESAHGPRPAWLEEDSRGASSSSATKNRSLVEAVVRRFLGRYLYILRLPVSPGTPVRLCSPSWLFTGP